MKNKYLYWLFCCLFAGLGWNNIAAAEELKMELKPDGMYIDNVTVGATKKIFEDYGYKDFVTDNNKIPPLFLMSMPADLDKMESKNERNRLFIMIMSPLALKVNEEIIFERSKLREIKEEFDNGAELTEEQKHHIDDLATKYDVFTRAKGRDYYDIILRELMFKVDVVAPSLLIAAAAAESNWGTAVEVEQGNALYKLKNWYSDDGIKPAGEDDDSYRIRVYPDLLSAIRDYALKINSDINFFSVRMSRRNIMNRNKTMRGRVTVHGMVLGSPLENYAGLLSYILTFYDLINVDESSLYSIKEMMEQK